MTPVPTGKQSATSFRSEQPAAARIAIFLPDLRGGGAERMRIRLARDWLAQGIAVEFILMRQQGELLPLLPEGATLHSLGIARYRDAVGPLVTHLRRTRPDVLLAAMWPLTVVAILAARLARFPLRVVVSDHNALSKAYADRGRVHRLMLGASMGAVYPFADGRIAVSKGVATDLSRLSGLAEKTFSVIYNPAGEDTAASEVSGSSRPHCLAPHARVILSVGTLKAQKDHALLIDAFARLPRDENLQLCILGEGDQRPALEAQVRSLDLEGRVLLPGFAPDPAPYYEAADLFVLSSRYEGFGNVIVEALAHGVPVVSTDCPAGPSEILGDGQWGRLVPVGDPEALALAMRQSLATAHDRDSLRVRAQDFAPRIVAQRYLQLMLPHRQDIMRPHTTEQVT